MCCTGMSTHNNNGKIMSRERFLKITQNKKSLNKKKPEPCMRIEALLEAALKRIRSESKQHRLNEDEEEEVDCTSLEPIFKRPKIEMFEYEDNYDYDDELSITESCLGEYTMISARELTSRTASVLWDDPEQVEDFLNKVSRSSDANNNNSNNECFDIKSSNSCNNNTKLKENMNTSSESDCSDNIDFDDGFLESMGDASTELSTLVSTYDDSFMFDDNLYKELIQNIINVESYMKNSQSACA